MAFRFQFQGAANMGQPPRCTIRCFMRHQVFYPGNVVEGFVELTVAAPVPMIAIRVKATGKEKVIARREMGVLYESRVVYKQLITIAGNMRCSGNRTPIVAPPGRYSYPFAFQLPMNIPPSMAKRVWADEADILYHIKAYVDMPYGRDAVDRQWFTVIKPMPRSQWLHQGPVAVNRSWNLTSCFCIDKGVTAANIHIDRTLIAIDRDNLTVTAEVDNRNGREAVRGISIHLMHILNYKTGFVAERHLLCEGSASIQQGVPAGGQGRISGTIPLPRNLVPTLVIWNITSEYYITVELKIPNIQNAVHNFPVIVAQAVDETEYSPPVTWNANPYTFIPKGQHPEFYYQPPPNPCYPVNPIPIGPPPGAVLLNTQLHPHMPLPPATAGWSAPTVYQASSPPTSPAQVHWQAGLEEEQLPRPTSSSGEAQQVSNNPTLNPAQPSPQRPTLASDDPSQPLLPR